MKKGRNWEIVWFPAAAVGLLFLVGVWIDPGNVLRVFVISLPLFLVFALGVVLACGALWAGRQGKDFLVFLLGMPVVPLVFLALALMTTGDL